MYSDVWRQTDFLINLLLYCAINRIAVNPETKENFRINKCMYLGVYHFKIALLFSVNKGMSWLRQWDIYNSEAYIFQVKSILDTCFRNYWLILAFPKLKHFQVFFRDCWKIFVCFLRHWRLGVEFLTCQASPLSSGFHQATASAPFSHFLRNRTSLSCWGRNELNL